MLKDFSLENPLVIIGQEDVVLGFKALGFGVYGISESKECSEILEKVIQQDIAICMIQEDFYNANWEQINAYRNRPLPIFIPFDKNGKTNLLEKIVKDIRLRATGTF